jgi:2-polyprenyl-6-methoxyphenol hydroxylase-like FAD-dependent oxidoreductase
VTDRIHDVAIVGYGPVGQTLAALLGKRGLDVAVFERFERPYGRPRAVRFDHEAMRIWQEIGIAEELLDDLMPVRHYDWFGVDGERIARFETPPEGPSGWAFSYSFFQPSLEAALDGAVRAQPTVELHPGWTLAGLAPHDAHVELELRRAQDSQTVRARYVVGADGANSFVREALGIEFEDLGFSERWFVVDLLPADRKAAGLEEFPMQFCQPSRPHMTCPNGRRHQRWEFMVLPDEESEEFERPEKLWKLLAPWLRPGEAEVVRQAVYEFRSAVATQMQSGRCLLAGDAAHLMPPYMGEGLCSGVRDATNLAWKLDLVVRGLASPDLLATYTPERRAHAAALVELSQTMGRVSCELDPQAAAARDREMRAASEVEPWPFPALGEGCDYRGPGSLDTLARRLAVQGTVESGGIRGRFDDVIGRGFVALARPDDPSTLLRADQLATLATLGAHLVSLGESGARDVDGRLTGWLDEHGAAAVVIRPDYYVFGAIDSAAALETLIDALLAQIPTPTEKAHA